MVLVSVFCQRRTRAASGRTDKKPPKTVILPLLNLRMQYELPPAQCGGLDHPIQAWTLGMNKLLAYA